MASRSGIALAALLAAVPACGPSTSDSAPAAAASLAYEVIPGSFRPNRGPDGNSVFLDAPEGLILVDTGRHPEHQQKLLDHARAEGKPIVAIFNTHWHLDHSGGNSTIREAFPTAKVYASNAIEGALKDFFPKSRAAAEQYLRSGQAGSEQEAEIRRDFSRMDNPDGLRATDPVTGSGERVIAGRPLVVNLAPHAATEGDVWIVDPRAGLAIVGDLVVGLVPFMDTACPDGWRAALDSIAATPFTTLVPGHGEVMDRSELMQWRTAFNNLLDCASSPKAKDECVAGWRRDAAAFIPAGDEQRVDGMVGYYIDSRLRAAPEELRRWCPKN